MKLNRYLTAFGVAAAIVSVPSAITLRTYHGYSNLLNPTSVIPVTAAGYAVLFAFCLGRKRVINAVRGLLIALCTFIATLCTHVSLLGVTSINGFIGATLLFLLVGLLGHGWYVLPIGAVIPWMVRRTFRHAP